MEKQLLEIEKKLVGLDIKADATKEALKEFKTEQMKLIKVVAGLNVKSSVWGIIGGVIPGSVILIFILIKTYVG